jgi:ribosome biogenesis GTPase / thiamine phosphate phosphatase
VSDLPGWGEPFASALHDLDASVAPARVVAVHRGRVYVAARDEPYPAAVRGALPTPPVVGDWVALDSAGAVCAVLPRRTALWRSRAGGADQPLAANVDVAFVVTAPDPDLNARRLERFAALAAGGGADVVLVLNKADLVADPGPALATLRAAAPGAPVLVTSAREGRGLDALASLVAPGRTAVLLGSSGVGKSTLVNALLGEARQVTRPVRASDARGRHATSHRELFSLPGGGQLIDAPGLRLPRLAAGGRGVAAAFVDVEALAVGCRFGDCGHAAEPGCAVLAAVEAGTLAPDRLDHWRRLEREQRRAGERAADRRARERVAQRAMNRVVRAR